jgi:glucose/arabinose dehydrogenase
MRNCFRWGLIIVLVASVDCHRTWAAIAGLERIATGLNRPVYVTHAPGDHDRLFIVQQDGVVKVWKKSTGSVNATPFLTVDVHDDGNEEGLLGLAFHPDYQNNGTFYINATIGTDTRTHVREYTVMDANPDVANDSFVNIIDWDQPQSNHNAGWIGFGPNDGYLYVSSGDGGGANDNTMGHTVGTGNAQDITDNLLGKMLRLDVVGDDFPTDDARNYRIPDSNPFADVRDPETREVTEVVFGDDEIWAYGLRNPWRNSFDRLTGDLWIGDVGQDNREEIDFQSANSTGGENYGWRLREGLIATPTGGVGGNRPPGNVDPVYDYVHGSGDFQGFSTVGGYVYRGPDPELQATYFFADSGSNNTWTFDPANPPVTVDNIDGDLTPNIGSVNVPVSFGEDAAGNLYLVDLGNSIFNPTANSGDIFRIVTDALLPGDYDADGDVDDQDYQAWVEAFGTNAALPDGNKNGVVDAADYTVWRDNHGRSVHDPGIASAAVAELSAVPEPAAVFLGIQLIGLMLLGVRRRVRMQ